MAIKKITLAYFEILEKSMENVEYHSVNCLRRRYHMLEKVEQKEKRELYCERNMSFETIRQNYMDSGAVSFIYF